MLKGRTLLVTWLCFIPITAWAQAEISDPRVTNIKNWIESTIKELGPDRVGAVLIFGIIGIIVFARLL